MHHTHMDNMAVWDDLAARRWCTCVENRSNTLVCQQASSRDNTAQWLSDGWMTSFLSYGFIFDTFLLPRPVPISPFSPFNCNTVALWMVWTVFTLLGRGVHLHLIESSLSIIEPKPLNLKQMKQSPLNYVAPDSTVSRRFQKWVSIILYLDSNQAKPS